MGFCGCESGNGLQYYSGEAPSIKGKMMIKLVKKFLKSNSIGRGLYEPLHYLYRLYSVPHRRRLLQSKGSEVLGKLKQTFENHNIPGFLAAGTLLGFIRDGGFMPHDDDIDVGVLPSKWRPNELLKTMVEEDGYTFEFAFKFRGKTVEFKVSWRDVPIDVFCYERENDDLYCTCFYYFPERTYPNAAANTPWRIHEYNITSLTQANLCGMLFPIPSEPEKVLEKLYGADWRVPNPNWNDSMHPGKEEMLGEFGFSVSYEEAILS